MSPTKADTDLNYGDIKFSIFYFNFMGVFLAAVAASHLTPFFLQ